MFAAVVTFFDSDPSNSPAALAVVLRSHKQRVQWLLTLSEQAEKVARA